MKKIIFFILILSLFVSSYSYAIKIKIPIRVIPVPGLEEKEEKSKGKMTQDEFTKMLCFPMGEKAKKNMLPELKKICDEKFPKNKFSANEELNCVLTASSYENPLEYNIILKTYKIYRGNFSTISLKKEDTGEEPKIYFGDLKKDELSFFEINEGKKLMTVYQLLGLKDNQRTFLIHNLNLNETNMSHLFPNQNSIYGKYINEENKADITGKLLNKEIKFLSNRLDEIKLIIMRDDQFIDQYIGANTYNCS